MAQIIKYESTKIDPTQSATEIANLAELLARRGVLESGERGVRLLAAGEAPQVYDIREGTEG